MIKATIVLAIIFVVIAGSFLYMIKPNHRRDTSYFKGKSYAHRGLHDEKVPENSLWAFKLARKEGYGVELDVQQTKDGQVVVFHDATLRRVCGVEGKVWDYTYEELQNFRLKDTDEKIPLFSDVLEALDGMDLICELKSDRKIKDYELCEKTYNLLMTYKGRFCIESFSPFIVGWFRKNHPEIIRGQLSENFLETMGHNVPNFFLTHLLVNVVGRPDFIAYNHKCDSFGLRVVRKFKPLMVCWTARGPKEQESAWEKYESVIFEKNPEIKG